MENSFFFFIDKFLLIISCCFKIPQLPDYPIHPSFGDGNEVQCNRSLGIRGHVVHPRCCLCRTFHRRTSYLSSTVCCEIVWHSRKVIRVTNKRKGEAVPAYTPLSRRRVPDGAPDEEEHQDCKVWVERKRNYIHYSR